MKGCKLAIAAAIYCAAVMSAQARLVEYNLDISCITVNYTGHFVKAIAVNGQTPGPTIEATEGDTLRITVNNHLRHSTSLHWHGVLLPYKQDGVPYLNTPPIMPGDSHTFEYKVIQSGTYWYHSHSGLQEQRGAFGPMVFHPKGGKTINSDTDHVLVLSDWNDMLPHSALASLKRDGDFFALKKNSVQSWLGVLCNGCKAIENRLQAAWNRMEPMDLSDIGYDVFLANGMRQTYLQAKKGQTVRVRVINAAASTYMNLTYAGGLMTVIAADGQDVVPFKVDKLPITNAETFDILVDVSENKSYELRATANDATGYSSTFIGEGDKVYAPTMPLPNLYLLTPHHDLHKPNTHPHGRYAKLKSPEDTTLPNNDKWRDVSLTLTGDMERYVWSMNDKTLHEADKILICEGENVRFIIKNETMMSHPMHLHGHFFRVLNGQGAQSPLKHTVDVPPKGEVAIEFAADHPGDWFFHCHNLYHMDAGMERFVSYKNHTTAVQETKNLLDPNPFYYSRDFYFLSNMMQGTLSASNQRNIFSLDYDYNYKNRYEIEFDYAYAFNRYIQGYAGIDIDKNDIDVTPDTNLVLGVRIILPMLINSEWRVNSDGKLRLQLGSELQLTKRFSLEWFWNTDKEYQLMLNYQFNPYFSFAGGYYNFFKWGGGVRLQF